MIPILFSENSTSYTSNGIGRLEAIYCKVTEERNGIYELEMQIPMTARHYADIGIRKIIVAKPAANATLQAFRIYKISKPINGKVTINAQHISYDLTKNVTMPFNVTAASTACNTTLQGLKTNAVEMCPFTFWTDVDTVASYSQKVPASIRQRLGGIEGSMLDQFGGEYEWDNWTVKLHKSRGSAKDITLRYGKNITDLDQEENIANTVTGVVPYWINTDGTESVTLTEKAIYSPNASAYSTHLTVPLDLSGEFENKPTETQLRNKATVYVNQSGFGLPKVSIKVSFINLADTEEYKDILPLQECSLCDTIKVQFERIGIDTTAKVVKTEYDVLAERYNSIEIGSLKSTLATTINDMNASMAQSIEESDRRIFADTSDLVDNATAWLTSSGGYVVAVKNTDGSWKELLFLDTNDTSTAHNVLRINTNGIGFSSNGVAGPYKQGWTLDGNILIGGSNAAGLTVYKRINNIDYVLFQVTPNYITWNTTNSSLDTTGKLRATNATFTGGTLNLGGGNDGSITMKDMLERTRGEWTQNKFGIYDENGTAKILFDSSHNIINGNLSCGTYNRSVDIENGEIKCYITYEDSHGYEHQHSCKIERDGNNWVLIFDDDSYIDGTGSGSGGGININSDAVVFSTDEIKVTRSRNSGSISTGQSGTIWGYLPDGVDGSPGTASLLEFVNGICVNGLWE